MLKFNNVWSRAIISIWIPFGDQTATRASEPNGTHTAGITIRFDFETRPANPNKLGSKTLSTLFQHEPTKPHAPCKALTTP
jgi:hypothetical protein